MLSRSFSDKKEIHARALPGESFFRSSFWYGNAGLKREKYGS
jgi:hypothetical protein